MKRRIITITAAVIAMTAFSSDSQAGNFKGYNGTMCEGSSSALIKQAGWVFNNSTTTTFSVDCPTVRDLESSAVIDVWALDRHTTADVRCYASSLVVGDNTMPWLGWWTPTATSTGFSANMQDITLGSISGNSSSILYITCSIPPLQNSNRSGVFGYHVYEA